MKTKPKPRARRMWANYYPAEDGCVCLHRTRTRANSMANDGCLHAAIPVAVIPLDDLYTLGDSMVSALAAIGVLPRTRKGGAK